MPIFGGASRAMVIGFKCPSCGEVQTHPRAPKGSVYVCRKCGMKLGEDDRTDGAAAARKTRR